jgi:hypothetical protein
VASKQVIYRVREPARDASRETKTMASNEEIETIAARAYDDVAREMEAEGVELSYAQADALGDEALDWLRTRLSLDVQETDEGVICMPR